VTALAAQDLLPPRFETWFAARGWAPRAHQLELLDKARQGRSALLIAPTGAGKTLAGFLPSLVELAADPTRKGLHTLYVSPLKALAVDVARNLDAPVAGMALPVRVESRTGDTPPNRRQRQRHDPPQILITTPEQVALLIAHPGARELFGSLRRVILDELHALVVSKRGELLSLGLARLRGFAPDLTAVGLSATVAEPDALRAYLSPRARPGEPPAPLADLVTAAGGASADARILVSEERVPWAGHTTRYAVGDIYAKIAGHKLTLVFVNTRSQAELVFQELWRINDATLPIALHHGSLDVAQRRRVEDAMAAGRLRAVVATATLDLGIDWGDVDLVIHVGAPKGASRLAQRIGRANHRLDEPSKAYLVPSNRFEFIECRAAIDALHEGAQDTERPRPGGLDVLAQHVLGCACGEPFDADALYAEIVTAAPYAGLGRADFDRVLDFVATGGYALRAYDRFARIRQDGQGRWRVANGRVAQQYRLNVGTIIESEMFKVRLTRARGPAAGGRAGPSTTGPIGRGGRVLGEIEEWYVDQLVPGDTFVFGGEVLRFEALKENEVYVSRSSDPEPKVPMYQGAKFPLSTHLAARVRAMIADPAKRSGLPDTVREWLGMQGERSALPGPDDLLVETFPRNGRHYLVCYPFDGRLSHQTLGMLLTRRLERAGAHPLGYVASDYALALWTLRDLSALVRAGLLSMDALFDEDMLGDDLEAWLEESSLMKRTFRNCAIISGLIERRHPGKEKTGRQVTISTDLVYNVLRSHEPEHIMLRAARADAATGLLDIARLGDMLARVRGRIVHRELPRVSPLSVPLMMEIGRETVYGAANEALLAEASDELVREAMGEAGAGGDRDPGGRGGVERGYVPKGGGGARMARVRRSPRAGAAPGLGDGAGATGGGGDGPGSGPGAHPSGGRRRREHPRQVRARTRAE